MSQKYTSIQQLIGLWQTFEEEGETINFKEFGSWLLRQQDTSPEMVQISEPKSASLNYFDDMELKQKLTILFSRLSKYQEFYVKKFFYGLPINNLQEFLFLLSINKNSLPKQNDIITLHLVEYTTGIEILKRLAKLNLIEESQDKLDRRSKRLKITAEGKRIIMEAMLRMEKINDLFISGIDEKQLQSLIPLLLRINKKNYDIFLNHNNDSYFELLEKR